MLEKKIGRYFRNSKNLSKYLCFKNRVSEERYYEYKGEAEELMSVYSDKKVRRLIRSYDDLKALTSYASSSMEHGIPPEAKKRERRLERDEQKLRKLQTEILALKDKMENETWNYNFYVTKHNELIDEYELLRRRYNRSVEGYSRLGYNIRHIHRISGGINLEPRLFNVKKTSTSNALKRFRSVAEKTDSKWRTIGESGEWIRSRARKDGSHVENNLPEVVWATKVHKKANGSAFQCLQGGTQKNYWALTESETGSWRDLLESGKDEYRERFFDSSSKQLNMVEFSSSKSKNNIVGRIVDENLIVFSKSSIQNLMKPQKPPLWWKP